VEEKGKGNTSEGTRRRPQASAAAQACAHRRRTGEAAAAAPLGARGGDSQGEAACPFYSGSMRAKQAVHRPAKPGLQPSHDKSISPVSPLQNCNKTPRTLSIHILNISVLHIFI